MSISAKFSYFDFTLPNLPNLPNIPAISTQPEPSREECNKLQFLFRLIDTQPACCPSVNNISYQQNSVYRTVSLLGMKQPGQENMLVLNHRDTPVTCQAP